MYSFHKLDHVLPKPVWIYKILAMELVEKCTGLVKVNILGLDTCYKGNNVQTHPGATVITIKLADKISRPFDWYGGAPEKPVEPWATVVLGM